MTAIRRTLLSAGIALGGFLVSIPSAFAQQNTSEISGLVTGPDGRAISGATVTAKNDGTGESRKNTTTSAGTYAFPGVEPGRWTLIVENPASRTVTVRGLDVATARRSVLNVRVEAGDPASDVRANSVPNQLLEPASSALGSEVPPANLLDVPLFVQGNLRNPEVFVTWLPGVVNGVVDTDIAGGLRRGKDVLIDGATATGAGNAGTVAVFPTLGQLSEFRLLTNSLPAEFGRTSGGLEIWTARRGFNAPHGNVFEVLRNDALDAAGWAVNSNRGRKPKLRQNEYGFELGGPVYIPEVYNGRNRTFFNVSLNDYKQNAGSVTTVVTIPTLAMRNGDFSRLLNAAGQQIPIYDPASEIDIGQGLQRTQFNGNRIPVNQISKVSTAILGYFPTPTNSALTNNYLGHVQTTSTRYAWGARGDQILRANRRLSAFVSTQRSDSNTTGPLPGALSAGNLQFGRYLLYRVTYETSAKPDRTNQITFGYTRAHNYWDRQPDAVQNWSQLLGLTGVDNAGSSSFPVVNFTGTGFLSLGRASDLETRGGVYDRTMSFTDAATRIMGRHEFKAGFDVRFGRNLQKPVIDSGVQGVFNFSNVQTSQVNAPGTTGNAFASFLLGDVDNASRVYASQAPDYRTIYGAGYIQDHFTFTSRLTIEAGLRYDLPGNIYDNNNTLSSFSPTVSNPAAGGRPGALVIAGTGVGHTGSKRFGSLDKTEFGPRVGIAYRIGNQTAVRAGYSLLYANGNGLNAAGCALCNVGATSVVQQTSNGLDAAFNWDQGLLAQPSFRLPPQVGPGVANGSPVVYIDPNNAKAPRFQNYSVGVQHQLPMAVLLEVAFAGNHGNRLSGAVPLNEVDPKYLSLGSLLGLQITDPAVVAAGFKVPYSGFTGTLAQALRPYPQFLDITDPYSATLHSDYKSLQVKMEKRAGAFTMQLNYTYSRYTSNGAASVALTDLLSPQNQYSLPGKETRQIDDIPHVLNLVYSWELPMGKGKRFLGSSRRMVNAVVGGWAIAAQQQYRSGNLLVLSAPNTLGNGVLFAPVTLPNTTGSALRTGTDAGSLDPNNPSSRWLNPAVFSTPAPFTLGTGSSLNDGVRNPRVLIENFSAIKRTYIKEGLNVEYRFDVANLFNRNEFGNINTVVGDPNFGRATGTLIQPRIIQMELKLAF